MNYMPEAIEKERKRLRNLYSQSAQKPQEERDIILAYDNSLLEINRLLDLSGELYILAIMHDIEKANQIVARFAKGS